MSSDRTEYLQLRRFRGQGVLRQDEYPDVVVAQQEAIIDVLKGALAAAGLDQIPIPDPWLLKLTRQQRAIIGALYHAYPKCLDKYRLLEVMPGLDHVSDRQAQIVAVQVSFIKKRLGPHCIENIWGIGYKLGAEFYASLPTRTTKPPAG